MHVATALMHPSSLHASITPCCICQRVLPEEQNQCAGCGDIICDSCPFSACSCRKTGIGEQLRIDLRKDAIKMRVLEVLGDEDPLSDYQTQYLKSLRDSVTQLRDEILGFELLKEQ